MSLKNGDRVCFSLAVPDGFPPVLFQGTLSYVLQAPNHARSACVIVDVVHSQGCPPGALLVPPDLLKPETCADG